MTHGTVKFFNAAKGFGFITPDSGGKDIFVSAASVSSAGIGTLKPGQRVAFEIKPDTRGPMAVGLGQLDEPPRPLPSQDRGPQNQLAFYFDPADDNAQDILEKLRAAGHEPRPIDYVAAPLKREQLKALSTLLAAKSQSLVKKYAALFYDLRLDDRFLSQTEYWDAIAEHPTLINGPIVATASDANLCNAKSGLKPFLAANFPHLAAIDLERSEAAKPSSKKHAPPAPEDEAGIEEATSTAVKAPKARPTKKANAAVAPKTKSRGPAKPKAAAKKPAAKSAKASDAKAPKPRSKK
jgi:CspA family cold shock protein